VNIEIHTHKELIEERNNKNLEKNQPQLQIQEVQLDSQWRK